MTATFRPLSNLLNQKLNIKNKLAFTKNEDVQFFSDFKKLQNRRNGLILNIYDCMSDFPVKSTHIYPLSTKYIAIHYCTDAVLFCSIEKHI